MVKICQNHDNDPKSTVDLYKIFETSRPIAPTWELYGVVPYSTYQIHPNPTTGSVSASFPSVLPSSLSGSSAFRFTSQAIAGWKALVAGILSETSTNHFRFKGDDTFLQALGCWSQHCPQRVNNKYILQLKRISLQRARVESLQVRCCTASEFLFHIALAMQGVECPELVLATERSCWWQLTILLLHVHTILLIALYDYPTYYGTLKRHTLLVWMTAGHTIARHRVHVGVMFTVKLCWTTLNIINWIVESRLASQNWSILNGKAARTPKSYRNASWFSQVNYNFISLN